MTFIGNNRPHSPDVVSSLRIFAFGALAGVVLFTAAYLAQLQYGNRALGTKHAERFAKAWHWVGYGATVFGIGLFVWGMLSAAHGFAQQFQAPNAEGQAELTGKISVDCRR